MDPERQPVLTGLDVARAAAIIANMIEAYLAGAPPREQQEPWGID